MNRELVKKSHDEIVEFLDTDPKYCKECGNYIPPEARLLLAIFGEEKQICTKCSKEVQNELKNNE